MTSMLLLLLLHSKWSIEGEKSLVQRKPGSGDLKCEDGHRNGRWRSGNLKRILSALLTQFQIHLEWGPETREKRFLVHSLPLSYCIRISIPKYTGVYGIASFLEPLRCTLHPHMCTEYWSETKKLCLLARTMNWQCTSLNPSSLSIGHFILPFVDNSFFNFATLRKRNTHQNSYLSMKWIDLNWLQFRMTRWLR